MAGADGDAGEEVVARARTPEGEEVVLYTADWRHIRDRRGGRVAVSDVLRAIADPRLREPDPKHPGRVRLWARGPGPARWLMVVVRPTRTGYRVVTAIPRRRGSRP